jgi:hypothetical protein
MTTDAPRSTPAPPGLPDALPLILRIGLIAGTLDITDALVFSYFRGATPVMVFQYIASGLIGRRSFVGLYLADCFTVSPSTCL